jgi:hypothetical protein
VRSKENRRARRRTIVPVAKKEEAAGWPALRTRDSDADGYSNEVELMFGSMPGRRDSHPWRPAAQLEGWGAIIARKVQGEDIAQLMFEDSRVRQVGPDTDGDLVPDVLEEFVGSDSRSGDSTPLVAARRLAVYRQLLSTPMSQSLDPATRIGQLRRAWADAVARHPSYSAPSSVGCSGGDPSSRPVGRGRGRRGSPRSP